MGGVTCAVDATPWASLGLLSMAADARGVSDASFSFASGAACGQSLRWVLNVDTRPHMGLTSLHAGMFQPFVTLRVHIC
jgi:hypothetical protein